MRKFNCHSDPAPILVREKNLWTCSRIIADKLRDPSLIAQDDRDTSFALPVIPSVVEESLSPESVETDPSMRPSDLVGMTTAKFVRERIQDDKKGFGMTSKGFTLAEIVVVMAIVAIVGTILVAIFTATLRGSSKSQMLSVIKQNGQAVLENMDKLIRGADKVECVSSDTLVIKKDNIYTRFRFISPIPSSANGKIQQDFPVSPSTACADSLSNTASTLTDTNTQTGVSVECVASNCNTNPIFARNSSGGFKDQVTVKFDLRPGVAAPQAVAGQIDPVTFQTTVQLRNLSN